MGCHGCLDGRNSSVGFCWVTRVPKANKSAASTNWVCTLSCLSQTLTVIFGSKSWLELGNVVLVKINYINGL